MGARSRENGPQRDPLHTTHINFNGTQFLRHKLIFWPTNLRFQYTRLLLTVTPAAQ